MERLTHGIELDCKNYRNETIRMRLSLFMEFVGKEKYIKWGNKEMKKKR